MENSFKYTCLFGGGAIRGVSYIGAIKAMEELNNLFPKCAPSPDRIPLCFVILDQYRSGK